jgi:hypothetical protein
MRILVEECIDERFRNSFPDHDCQTARYAGLTGLKNGDLLAAAETAGFDVFLTVDQGNLAPLLRGRTACFLRHSGAIFCPSASVHGILKADDGPVLLYEHVAALASAARRNPLAPQRYPTY